MKNFIPIVTCGIGLAIMIGNCIEGNGRMALFGLALLLISAGIAGASMD